MTAPLTVFLTKTIITVLEIICRLQQCFVFHIKTWTETLTLKFDLKVCNHAVSRNSTFIALMIFLSGLLYRDPPKSEPTKGQGVFFPIWRDVCNRKVGSLRVWLLNQVTSWFVTFLFHYVKVD